MIPSLDKKDHMALSWHLKNAIRKNDADSIIEISELLVDLAKPYREKCEGLTAHWCWCGDCSCDNENGIGDPNCQLHSLTSLHTGDLNGHPIREAFRQLLTEPILTAEQANRIADCSLLLQSPQPIHVWRYRCKPCKTWAAAYVKEIDAVVWDNYKCPSTVSGMHDWERLRVLSPLHALRIWVDALQIGKGENWWHWIRRNSFGRIVKGGALAFHGHGSLWTSKPEIFIYPDGFVEAGDYIPEGLPRTSSDWTWTT